MNPREEYEQDPQAWVDDHTVDGIRPHIPQSHDDREEVMAEILWTWSADDLERTKNEIMADWDGVADTGALNIVRGTE
jgi:hypothetical protein